MSKPILYRPNQRWQMWLALGGSILIHVGAVAARHTTRPFPPGIPGDEVISITFEQPQSPPEEPRPTDPPLLELNPPPIESDKNKVKATKLCRMRT